MLAKEKNIGKECIIKIIRSEKQSVNEEAEIGKILEHDNISKLIYACTEVVNEEQKPGVVAPLFYFNHLLVFNYIKGVDLLEYLESMDYPSLPETQLRRMFSQIVNALSYCHERQIGHRDIKLENIMIEEYTNKAYLIDFGFGVDTRKKRPSLLRKREGDPFYVIDEKSPSGMAGPFVTGAVGSVPYVAPEVVQKPWYCPFKADIWSLGTCIYACAFGQVPWEEEKRLAQLKQGLPQAHLFIPERIKISIELNNLLFSMLEPEPIKRLSIEQVKRHPWFQIDS